MWFCASYISDNSPYTKADSIHDSSSGFASDVQSYNSNGSTMSTFKGTHKDSSSASTTTGRDSCISMPMEKERLKPPWSTPDTPAYKHPKHYHPQDLNMPYRMSTPSPMSNMSNRSVSSASHGSHSSHASSYSMSHGSSHRSSVKSSPMTPHFTSPPVITYQNPAYEYQLDRHMEEIQNNIKRIEIHDTDNIISSKMTSHYSCMSVFDLLADDIIVRIFSHLSSDHLCLISRVCQRWYRLVWDPILWKHIVIKNEKLDVDKALRYLTKRLSYNTPTVCVIVESIKLTGCERLSNKGLHTIAKRCPELRHLELQGCSNISNTSLFEVTSYCVNLEHLNVTGRLKVNI